MSNAQIKFKYRQENIIIQCLKNDLMKNIISRYETKSGLSANEFNFLYNGNKINPNLTLSQINDKDHEILILVTSIENEKNENQKKISDYIKCAQSLEPAILEFSNDYKVSLTDGKNRTQKIRLKEYSKTQIVDENQIKCSNCTNIKAQAYQSNFFYCFECDKNLCPVCQSLHKEHKNIVNYSVKYFRCSFHKDKEFISYCLDCNKNLCIFCINQHKEHNIINFTNLFMEQNKETIEKIQKVKELFDNIIDSLPKFKDNLDVYVQINEKLNENLVNMNLNYKI